MKILINLFSEQTIPNLIPILQLRPDKVIALATDKFAYQSEIFEQITKVPHELHQFDAYEFQNDIAIINKLIRQADPLDEIFINFTGGTKIMSMAAVLGGIAKRMGNISLIYVDTMNEKIIKLMMTDDGLKIDSKPITVVIPFPNYIALSQDIVAFSIEKQTPEEIERIPLSEELAYNKSLTGFFDGNIQREMCVAENKKVPLKLVFQGKWGVKGEAAWDLTSLSFIIPNGESFRYNHSDGGRYFSGQWLEEFVFNRLLKSKTFDFVSRNVVLSLRSESIRRLSEKRRKSPFTDKNELDVVAIAGKRAAIIECKAGNVLQDHIYKLASLRDYLLGTFGVAILVCRFTPGPHIIEKCNDLGIKVISASDLEEVEKEIIRTID